MDRLIITVKAGTKTIKFNKPERKNAVYWKVYRELGRILNEDAKDDSIIVTIFTGVGEYFTSGNDFKAILESATEDNIAQDSHSAFKDFVTALIDYPKILIAVVNGPAIGIGATILGLVDVAYASDRAIFSTPFVRIGLCAEACSSLMLPLIMGRSRGSEMILLTKTMTAQEAERYGLVSRVIPHEKLDEFIEDLHQYAKELPVNAVKINKKLIVDNYRKWLHDSNESECLALIERSTSEDFMNAIVNFMSRKNKL